MDYLDSRKLIDHTTRKDLLGNHLVLIEPALSRLAITIAPNFDLAGALAGGRLAVADPDSVPAGKYAKAALTTLHVWESVSGHLAGAENVRAALAYVALGGDAFGYRIFDRCFGGAARAHRRDVPRRYSPAHCLSNRTDKRRQAFCQGISWVLEPKGSKSGFFERRI